MPKLRSLSSVSSPISLTAMLAICVLLSVIAVRITALMRADADTSSAASAETSGQVAGADWQQEMALLGLATTSDPRATSDDDPISMIGPALTGQLIGLYTGLVGSGDASADSLAAAGESVAPNVRAILTYNVYEPSDIATTPDTTFDRMIEYRADMRTALAPLLKNKSDELELYGAFVETGDTKALDALRAAAVNYRLAASESAKVVVPRDALVQHLGILNAMQAFAAALDGLATHTEDPFTSAALVRSYTDAEADMYTSFDALAKYYANKKP